MSCRPIHGQFEVFCTSKTHCAQDTQPAEVQTLCYLYSATWLHELTRTQQKYWTMMDNPPDSIYLQTHWTTLCFLVMNFAHTKSVLQSDWGSSQFDVAINSMMVPERTADLSASVLRRWTPLVLLSNGQLWPWGELESLKPLDTVFVGMLGEVSGIVATGRRPWQVSNQGHGEIVDDRVPWI